MPSPLNLTNCSGSTEDLQTRHEGQHPLGTGTFDLAVYTSFYAGHSKTTRLRHIADVNPELQDEALRLLAANLEANGNLEGLKDLGESKHKAKLVGLGLDNTEWAVERRNSSNVEIGKLERALREADTDHAACRSAYIALGDAYYSIGELTAAKKDYYQHALEHGCSLEEDPAQYQQWCLKMVKTSVNNTAGSFNMNDHFQRAKHGATPELISQLEVSRGLAHLMQASKGLRGNAHSKAYDSHLKSAAQSFVRATVDMGYGFSEVIVPQDVAAYGGLCALATMERDEIKRHLIQSRSFKKMLSLVPMVESAVKAFYNSSYTAMLSALESIRPILQLDVYFNQAVDRVYTAILSRAMIQFVSPYAVVKLSEMASVFQMDQPTVEAQLRELILSEQIHARIDSRNGSLVASNEPIRTNAFDKSLESSDVVEDTLVRMLLTKSILKDDLIVADPRKKELAQAAMGGMGGMMSMMSGMM